MLVLMEKFEKGDLVYKMEGLRRLICGVQRSGCDNVVVTTTVAAAAKAVTGAGYLSPMSTLMLLRLMRIKVSDHKGKKVYDMAEAGALFAGLDVAGNRAKGKARVSVVLVRWRWILAVLVMGRA